MHFLREEHSVFTKELWQSSLCVPTTYGPRVQVALAGQEHSLPVRVRWALAMSSSAGSLVSGPAALKVTKGPDSPQPRTASAIFGVGVRRSSSSSCLLGSLAPCPSRTS